MRMPPLGQPVLLWTLLGLVVVPLLALAGVVATLDCYLIARVYVLPAVTGSYGRDFDVLGALKLGMSRTEAAATISSFSFHLEQSVDRPAAGWPDSDNTFANRAGRGKMAEVCVGRVIRVAECYPVSHGLLGFGELFLFYDEDNRLAHFYRREIN